MPDQEELEREEQNAFNEVIDSLDRSREAALADLNEQIGQKMDYTSDDYSLIASKATKIEGDQRRIRELNRAESQLYISHVELDWKDSLTGVKSTADMFIGKVGYFDHEDPSRQIIYSWNSPVAWHYISQNPEIKYIYHHKDQRYGETTTEYELKKRRDLKIVQRKIAEVREIYSAGASDEEVSRAYYDAFLADLAERRGQDGPSDIIMTVQREQADIINEPFDQDLIIQGCAGSGKSMIMLHRLPVLLYDEEHQKLRKGIRIITPSEAYIDSVSDLIVELDISDITESTLETYYSEKLDGISGVNFRHLMKPRSTMLFSGETLEYVYSEDILDLLQYLMEHEAKKDLPEYEPIKQYYEAGNEKPVLSNLSPIEAVVSKRSVVAGAFEDQEVQKIFASGISKIEKLLDQIEENTKRIKKYAEEELHFDLTVSETEDEEDIDEVPNIEVALAEDFRQMQAILDGFRKPEIKRDALTYSSIGTAYAKKACGYYFELPEFVHEVNNRYDSIRITFENEEGGSGAAQAIKEFQNALEKYSVAMQNSVAIKQRMSEARDLLDSSDVESVLAGILHEVMKDIHTEDERVSPDNSYSFTPYLLLWLAIYARQKPGKPISPFSDDRLVMIDEAQTLMPTEIELIKTINRNVTMNLFGDVHQHVKDEKGMDEWPEDLEEKYHFKRHEMENNYRNAETITKYCNDRLGLNMYPISLPGDDVVEEQAATWKEALGLISAALDKRTEGYRVGVIFKEPALNDTLRQIRDTYACNIIDDSEHHISKESINMVRVRYVKGVEFDEVIVVNSGKFSEEELYIAYTRALSKLTVINVGK